MTAALVDGWGRRVRVLRLSLTDRCNFRCVYCVPPEGVSRIPRRSWLGVESIERIVRACANMGVRRVRLTGGEPLLRPRVVDVVRAIRSVRGVEEVAMTTNGSRLAPLAGELRAAGLDRVNVSLDSLRADRFVAITNYHRPERVRAGIDAALEAGLSVKINVVVMRGMPEEEILDFVRLACERRVEVRFLEFMPLCGGAWRPDRVYPVEEIRARIERHFRLEALPRGDAPAEPMRVVDGGGRIGFVGSLTRPFCDACSRIRVSADGRLRPCLFSTTSVDLRPALASGSDDALERAIRRAVARKPRGNAYRERPFDPACTVERVRARRMAGVSIRTIGG